LTHNGERREVKKKEKKKGRQVQNSFAQNVATLFLEYFWIVGFASFSVVCKTVTHQHFEPVLNMLLS